MVLSGRMWEMYVQEFTAPRQQQLKCFLELRRRELQPDAGRVTRASSTRPYVRNVEGRCFVRRRLFKNRH